MIFSIVFFFCIFFFKQKTAYEMRISDWSSDVCSSDLLNCMILSLLYRLTPDQCKMIMIDPKMLELSMYEDIPHLLAPVVTEPPKAVRALKWAVEQMEDRYRMMASVGVRSLSSFNEKEIGSAACRERVC